jgi:MFS family permease
MLPITDSLNRIVSFWKRQDRNWRTIVLKNVFGRFFDHMTNDYTNIYVTELGASPVELGFINSISRGIAALISIPTGWLQDRYSLRKMFIIGLGISILASLFYATASSWLIIIPAIILAQVATQWGNCVVFCDFHLHREDRSAGKALCEGIGNIPSLVAPIVATFIITFQGGISAEAIRPLYWMQFASRFILISFMARQLKDPMRLKKRTNFSSGMHEVFNNGTALKRWMLFLAVGSFAMAMMNPFRLVFAYEIKKADQNILGLMTVTSLLAQIIFLSQLGNLVERFGERKLFYVLLPITCFANIILIIAPSPEFLIVSALIQGSSMMALIIVQESMSAEPVPINCLGRWRGILGLSNGLASISSPTIGGVIWERIGPSYVFIIPIAIYLFIQLPLLTTLPKTSKTLP